MPLALNRPQDFEVDGTSGRCTVCKHGAVTKLANLIKHEKTESHRVAVRIMLTQSVPPNVDTHAPSRSNPYTATVEDCLEDDDWLYGRPHNSTDIDGWTGIIQANEEPVFSAEMRAALAGQVNFSAGEDTVPDVFESTLEEALRGVPILNAAIRSSDGEELPGLMDGDDDDSDDEVETETLDLSAQDIAASFFGGERSSNDYFPYPNKAMMKTDILFSSPRLRFSRAQQDAVLSWGKELGAKDVPSLYALRKFQTESLKAVGNPTDKITAPSGNVFYVNDICASIAKDYAHPDTRKHLRAYPEATSNTVREAWQAEKWLYDVPDDCLTPMVRLDGKDYYINELTHCESDEGVWFIPERFFDFENKKWSVGRAVTTSDAGLVVSESRSIRACETFRLSWPDVEACNTGRNLFAPCSVKYADRMPNPDRETAQGLEWECPPVIVFIDDVSGNSTKQWNVHYSCYFSNGGLPRQEIEKEANVRFVSTSPNASPMEIIQAVTDAIKKTGGQTPLKVWDCERSQYILVRLWLLLLPGDNPMQAEECSHIGLKGNFFCRCCHAGGTTKFKESDEGYPTLAQPGVFRTVEETRRAVIEQLIASTKAASEKTVKEAVTASGVKDSFATPVIVKLIKMGKAFRRAAPGRKALTKEEVNKLLTEELKRGSDDATFINPLLGIPGFDPHKDTPVEPLHTHLLGIVKYFWAQTVWILEKNGKFGEFQARLNSLEMAGLKIPNIMADYMCRYRGGLIGKHFKTISQVMPFAICGLVSEDVLNAWTAIGRLTVLIWETEIIDLAAYTIDLTDAIQDIMDFAATCSPSILAMKPKFHILCHLPFHILRFGPAVLFSTERYEAFNRIFRLCSIYSNRQAPSRDIASCFAHLDRCRHIVTGGYWLDTVTQQWVRAGDAVLEHIKSHRIDAKLLGVYSAPSPVPGTMTLPPRPRGQPVKLLQWSETVSSHSSTPIPARLSAASHWCQAGSVVTSTGDTACIGNEVIVQAEGGEFSPLVFATIVELLFSDISRTDSLVTVRLSQLGRSLHSELKIPTIERSSHTGSLVILEAANVVCVPNVQHDCHKSQCNSSETQRLRQEREETTRTRAIISHRDAIYYTVNTNSIHNSRHIRQALPAILKEHPKFITDRPALYLAASSSLRDQKLQKKLAKEAATRLNAENARNNLPELPEIDAGGSDAEVFDETGQLEPDHEAIVATVAPLLAPRGPRGRRLEPLSRGRGHGPDHSQGSGRGRGRGTGRGMGRGSGSLGPGLSIGSSSSVADSPPVRKKRRVTAADPVNEAHRERELRGMFQ